MINVQRVTKYYGKNRGIENLTLHVPKGVIYGFPGPDGAGKTTTIRVLPGLKKTFSLFLGMIYRITGAVAFTMAGAIYFNKKDIT